MIYDLRRVPAFGFESKNIRAKTIADLQAEKIINKLEKNKGILKGSLKTALEKGIDKYGSKEGFCDQLSLSTYKTHNLSKIGGYFPGIGTLKGISKIYTASTTYKNNDHQTKLLIVRGIIETLSLGFLFIPVDIWVTHLRKQKWKKLNSMS